MTLPRGATAHQAAWSARAANQRVRDVTPAAPQVSLRVGTRRYSPASAARHFHNTHRLKKQHNFDTNQFSLRPSGTLPRHSVFSFDLRRRLGLGITMKSAIAAQLPDEHFVIRVDGRVKSHHRRFLDALREGLQLRDQFPRHDVKVQLMAAESQPRTALP
jgi:hypothetical protein